MTPQWRPWHLCTSSWESASSSSSFCRTSGKEKLSPAITVVRKPPKTILAQTGAQAARAGWVLQHRAEFAVVSSTWAAGSAGAPQFIASGEVLFCLSVCVMAVLNACDAHALYSLATGSSAPKETVYYSDTVACPWKKAQTGAQSKGKSKKV